MLSKYDKHQFHNRPPSDKETGNGEVKRVPASYPKLAPGACTTVRGGSPFGERAAVALAPCPFRPAPPRDCKQAKTGPCALLPAEVPGCPFVAVNNFQPNLGAPAKNQHLPELPYLPKPPPLPNLDSAPSSFDSYPGFKLPLRHVLDTSSLLLHFLILGITHHISLSNQRWRNPVNGDTFLRNIIR